MLDNSGSMGICSVKDTQGRCQDNGNQPFKIDIAKRKIIDRISKPDFKFTQVGLVEFGNHREYKIESETRCSAVKLVVEPKENNQATIIKGLETIKSNDDGITPIAYAINFVVNEVLRKNSLSPANILLITDGQANCQEHQYNLCDLVSGLASRDVELKINIIGYRAEGNDSDFVKCAENFPGMVDYLSAKNPDELEREIEFFLPPNKLPSPKNVPNWSIPLSSTILVIMAIPIILYLKKVEEPDKIKLNVYTLERSDEKMTTENYNFNITGGTQSGVFGKANNNVTVSSSQNTYISKQRQTLTKAAAEIQNLLRQLEKTRPDASDAEKISHVNEETTPRFKQAVLRALQSGGEVAIEEFFDNSYVNISKALIKGWREGWVEPN